MKKPTDLPYSNSWDNTLVYLGKHGIPRYLCGLCTFGYLFRRASLYAAKKDYSGAFHMGEA